MSIAPIANNQVKEQEDLQNHFDSRNMIQRPLTSRGILYDGDGEEETMNNNNSTAATRMEIERITHQRRVPLRILAEAVILTALGIIFLIAGLVVKSKGDTSSLPLFLICAFTLIPGSYTSAIIIGTLLEWPGWSTDSIPSFDNVF